MVLLSQKNVTGPTMACSALNPPFGEQGGYLGTTDSTDLLLKANNQPMLRVGADGNMDVLGQLRVPAMAPAEGEGPVALGIGPFGAVTPMLPCFPRLVGDEIIIDNPQWASGPNKIYTDCGPVNVGIGTSEPESKLDVRGTVKANGVHTGGLRVSSGAIFENTIAVNTEAPLSGAKVDVRGKVAIGYQDGVGPDYANATLDVRADGDPARFTFETRDNAGRSSFRVRNNGRVVVGDGAFNDAASGNAFLFFGDESNSIRAANGFGMFFSTTNSPDILYLKDGAIKVGIGTQDPFATLHIQDVQAKLRVGQSDNYMIMGYDGANSILNSYGSNLLINYYNGNDVVFGAPSTNSGGGGGNISVRIYGDLTVCDKLNIVTNEFCDFVFDPDYKRMSFIEKEAYYRTNRHLISMPPEKEILQNGLDVETIIKGLTLNVEELSLDQIDLYKMVLELKEENRVLKEQMGQLLKK